MEINYLSGEKQKRLDLAWPSEGSPEGLGGIEPLTLFQIIKRIDAMPPTTAKQGVNHRAAFVGFGMPKEQPIRFPKCAGQDLLSSQGSPISPTTKANGKAAGIVMGGYDFARPNENAPAPRLVTSGQRRGTYIKADGFGGQAKPYELIYNGSWDSWSLYSQGTCTSSPSAVSWSPGRTDFFVRGPNNSCYHLYTQ